MLVNKTKNNNKKKKNRKEKETLSDSWYFTYVGYKKKNLGEGVVFESGFRCPKKNWKGLGPKKFKGANSLAGPGAYSLELNNRGLRNDVIV